MSASWLKGGAALLPALLCVVQHVNAQKAERLKPTSWLNVKVPEPSDIAAIPGTNRFYCVSDNGHVMEIGADGRVIREARNIAYDLEGLLLQDDTLIVVDERSRNLIWLTTADLKPVRRLTIPYHGGRNRGYEAIVWNPVKQRYLLITERDPVRIIELDVQMRVVNEVPFDAGVRDISSAVWHDEQLWLLSDMDMHVLRCDPMSYAINARWSVPVINPEGMAISNGKLHVLSDDRQRLYTYELPGHAH
ncbi:MAG: SdiA-regulated domain-containing protein, partial [Flavobacteriales bacterium]